MDGIKIDLKAYDEGFYRDVCEAELAPVLRTLRIVREMGVHLEIVNLIVPTLNDSLDQLRALARWVAGDLSPDVPLHFTRFHPQYKLTNLPPTPLKVLEEARQIGISEGLNYVYIGNLASKEGQNTYCPGCKRLLIERSGWTIREMRIRNDCCPGCGKEIYGVWK